MIFPTVISLTCGQNITIETLVGVASLVIQCILSFPLTTAEVYKDGELVSNNFSLTITPASNADFGTYTFVASTEGCGSTSAVSRILRKGQFYKIYISKVVHYNTTYLYKHGIELMGIYVYFKTQYRRNFHMVCMQ